MRTVFWPYLIHIYTQENSGTPSRNPDVTANVIVFLRKWVFHVSLPDKIKSKRTFVFSTNRGALFFFHAIRQFIMKRRRV